MKLVTTRIPDEEKVTPWAGSFFGSLAFFTIVIALLGLAVWNLIRIRELPLSASIASVIWIAFNVLCIWISISIPGGFQRCAIAELGGCGIRNYVWIDRSEGECPCISVGYRIGRRRFLYDSFPAVQLLQVKWYAGQASAMSAQEMADWRVTMWFRPTEPRSQQWSEIYHGQCGFGGCGEKARVAEFGESLVVFLRRAGVEFEPLPEGCGYQVVRGNAEEGKMAVDLP